jgi:hypothetical protein
MSIIIFIFELFLFSIFGFVFLAALMLLVTFGEWIYNHLAAIIITIVGIGIAVYLIRLIIKSKVIPRAYERAKQVVSPGVIKIKQWNDKYKPRDVKSMQVFGFISILIGIVGAVAFYSSGLWIISLFYLMFVISGVHKIVYPGKELKNINK